MSQQTEIQDNSTWRHRPLPPKSLAPWIGVCLLAGSAVIKFPGQSYALIFIMLFWPFLDSCWLMPKLPHATGNRLAWAALIAPGAVLLLWQPSQAMFAATTLITAALPEEWFFRAYLMARLGSGWRANILASLVFSLLHGLTGGWLVAVLVFVPSLFYGWLYQRTRDLPLLVLTHALSNLIFALFLVKPLSAWLGYLLGFQG